MADQPYLLDLAMRLSDGLERLEPSRRNRHVQFLLSQQMPDGGFRGREGDSDLYYTSFAVRGLAILGSMDTATSQRVGEFLAEYRDRSMSVVDLISWMYSAFVIQVSGGVDLLGEAAVAWAENVAAKLESVRTKDGGYAKSIEGASGSMYHSFLTMLTYELIGRTPPQPNRLIQFIYDRQRDDGGFVEIGPMRRSGTNPTAAAVAMLTSLGGMDQELANDVQDFFREVRSSEGGFQANTRIPFADGLSTFTGLLTCQDLKLNVLKPVSVENLVGKCLEFPTGGFRGASWDEQADVEYTFYGLGNLGLLWSADEVGKESLE
ncbi:MAG: terpene cyclase/mutase family protein [Planctomycetota bacterium]|nr:terpene cyclase/mutase family protein [Planctomycetota bacterium]